MDRLIELITEQIDIITDNEELRDDCEKGTDNYRYHNDQIQVHTAEMHTLVTEYIRLIEKANVDLRKQLRVKGSNKVLIRKQLRDHNEGIDWLNKML